MDGFSNFQGIQTTLPGDGHWLARAEGFNSIRTEADAHDTPDRAARGVQNPMLAVSSRRCFERDIFMGAPGGTASVKDFRESTG
jgi:hypothetical protein